MIATMTVLVTGLMFAATLDDAEAKKAKTGEHKLKCKSIGSWFNPVLTAPWIFSSSEGKCSAGLGKVTSASVTVITGGPDAAGCITLITAPIPVPDSDEFLTDFSMGKKGFIEYTSTATQCFWDETGAPTGPVAWCELGGAHTSTIIGEYTILDGKVKDTPVTGGEGGFVSKANHCDDDAPYGNSFTTKLNGTIIFQ